MWDYINFAKSQGIPVGPGRGSGAGSIAAYCVGITDIDPIRYNLTFCKNDIVPHDEVVVGIPHGLDHTDLVFQAVDVGLRHIRAVAALQAVPAEFFKVGLIVHAVRGFVVRDLGVTELKVKIALLGDLCRVGAGFRHHGEQLVHLVGGLDVDFCYERRQEVIDYVNRKYGADHVAQIVTFGTMAARNAIRDVGRVMGIPNQQVDVVAKLVPMELKMTLKRALEVSSELKKLYDTDPQVTELIDTALKVEGMPRHASTHAAGVVITPEPTDYYLPLATNDGLPVTQFNMTEIEELGLLKMDFLGLRTLTVIRDAEVAVQKQHPEFSIRKLDYDDPDTYKMLGQGDTEGVFQLESSGMKQVLVGLQPQNLEDVIALISLYRPGPMDSIPTYLPVRRRSLPVPGRSA